MGHPVYDHITATKQPPYVPVSRPRHSGLGVAPVDVHHLGDGRGHWLLRRAPRPTRGEVLVGQVEGEVGLAEDGQLEVVVPVVEHVRGHALVAGKFEHHVLLVLAFPDKL